MSLIFHSLVLLRLTAQNLFSSPLYLATNWNAIRYKPTPVIPGADGRGDTFRIFIKTLTGTSEPLSVLGSDTVWDVKNLIAESWGSVADQQRLLFSGKQLEDDRTL